MEINRMELLRALEIVKPGTSNNENIEQATNFAFLNGGLVTYNDAISISHPIADLGFTGAVVADKLYAFLNKIKKDVVEIDVEGSELIISSGRSKAGLTLTAEIKLPLHEIEGKKKWSPLPEKFLKHLSFAMRSCGKELNKPILSCVYVTEEGVIAASDGYRIVRCEIGEGMPVKAFLLPATSAIEVVKLNPTKISAGKGWIHFQTDAGTMISCRLYEGKYPNVESALVMPEGTTINFPKTINEALDRAIVFAKRTKVLEEQVTITVSNNRFKIFAEADGGEGWFEEEINLKYDGEPIKFLVTPYLLKGVLDETQEGVLSENKLKFIGEDWVYLTMLRK